MAAKGLLYSDIGAFESFCIAYSRKKDHCISDPFTTKPMSISGFLNLSKTLFGSVFRLLLHGSVSVPISSNTDKSSRNHVSPLHLFVAPHYFIPRKCLFRASDSRSLKMFSPSPISPLAQFPLPAVTVAR